MLLLLRRPRSWPSPPRAPAPPLLRSASTSAGLVGLPNVGKSSLYTLLTSHQVPAENFPFCTIDPTTARCAVPDKRYDHLVSLWLPANKYPAVLSVTDIAGLVKGASEGAGLGNAFLSHIQAVDALVHVVRSFDSDEVVHVEDSVDPVRDLETIQHELCLKDLQYVDAAEAAAVKDLKKTPTMKLPLRFYTVMERARALLAANLPVRNGPWDGPEVETIREKLPALITTKPILYMVNLSAADFLRKKNKHLPAIAAWVEAHGGGAVIPFSVEFEQKAAELAAAGDEAAAAAYAQGAKSALPRCILTSYKELELVHFFTCGEKEVRAWTVPRGACAPEAGGAIHGDFASLFISADVCSYEDFKAHASGKSFADVRAAGKMRSEGKNYVVCDASIHVIVAANRGAGRTLPSTLNSPCPSSLARQSPICPLLTFPGFPTHPPPPPPTSGRHHSFQDRAEGQVEGCSSGRIVNIFAVGLRDSEGRDVRVQLFFFFFSFHIVSIYQCVIVMDQLGDEVSPAGTE